MIIVAAAFLVIAKRFKKKKKKMDNFTNDLILMSIFNFEYGALKIN